MGSRTLVHAAVGSDGEAFKGEYLSDCKVDEYDLWDALTNYSVSEFVQSDEGQETQKRLWREMMDILTKVAPEVGKVL